MEITNISLVYFSATYTTRKIVRKVAQQITGTLTEYDITNASPAGEVMLNTPGDLLIVGVPVYSGRVPISVLTTLNMFKGHNTPVIVICVYGNRDYDDALLELKEIVEANGFKTIAAGAFIAKHSVFPQVAAARPDSKDIQKIEEFGNQCREMISKLQDVSALPQLKVNGNKPYKLSKDIPIHPSGKKSKCNECGVCVKLCPVQAIPPTAPYKTNAKKCISCGRCIVVCSQNSRKFYGLLYKIAGWKFAKDNSLQREPEYFLLSL